MSFAAADSAASDRGAEKRRYFEFHSHCGLNLHHFLYWKAHPHSRKSGPVAQWPAALTEEERQVVEEAIDYYRQAFEGEDLLFGEALHAIKRQLIRHDGGASFDGLGLEPRHAAVLAKVQPVYRWHLWPAHQASNRRWIEHTAREVSRWGDAIAGRLEALYGDPFPPTPIRLDVVVEGHWAGAYTSIEPVHIVVASTRADYQGKGALEMVFHEASHGILGPGRGTVIEELRQAFAEQGQPTPRNLWHALLFYTTGRVTQDLYRREGLGPYEPYAHANGLYRRAWGTFLPVLEEDWQAYLDGEASLHQAAQQMAARLAEADASPTGD
ncbi:MAG: hypothetical protein AAF657_14790 [Acidobacteriota bacterium]